MRIFTAVIFLAVVLMCGCQSASQPDSIQFRFVDAVGAKFSAVTDDSALIVKARVELRRPLDERRLHINGEIGRGNNGHNAPWSWHLKPSRWDLVEISMKLCDGTCQMVEEDIDRWVDDVGRFCPWRSRVIEEMTSNR